MEFFRKLFDLLRHLGEDEKWRSMIDFVGPNNLYIVLFAIIFAETGLVVTPFLPGDSLLFAAGAIAATGAMDPWLLTGLMTAAAILGNTVNYSIGRSAGLRIIERSKRDPRWARFIQPAYIERARQF